jgi:hypothetical protein
MACLNDDLTQEAIASEYEEQDGQQNTAVQAGQAQIL